MPLALLTRPLQACVLVLAALLAVTAYAGPAQDFAAADNGGRAHLLEHWAATPDADRLAFLEALRHNRIALDSRQQPFILGADQRFQAAEGDALPDGEPKPLRLNNRLRGLLNTALASHQLVANEVPLRLAAAQQLQKTAKAAQRPLLEARLRIESDAGVKEALGLALANLQLGDPDPALRLSAVRLLGESGDPLARTRLENLLDPAVEPEEGVRIAAATSLAQVKRRLLVGDLLGQAFSGLSLGSILLLAALGLAITYGLLGVINMAHGEMLMLGAYSTYVVQLLFQRLAPEWLALYPLLALPVAFCVSAAIGMALERTVIRHLYGRPLETLLATWGISLVLIQLVRMLFGAQNVEVANPAWLSGGIQVLPNLVLPWNRIVIIGFALFVLLLTWLLLNRTRLGLNVRAVTQNRNMAACCGVPTGRVDMLAFGLGSGIAGLGGVALSQVGNVGPDLGQGYIIDSFLVVVLGGVGQLAGSVLAAFGLGVANKILEPQIGAVLGKILILALIVLFIQETPAGTVRPEREGHRLNQPLTVTLARRAGGRVTAIALGAAFATLLAMPLLHLLPADSALHLSAYSLTLTGKILCYAIVALALDLVWGYAGLLSLGHGLFFALGGYAMGMYLMRQASGDSLPAFMTFLSWNELPWYWAGTQHFLWALCLVVLVPGALAFAFGYFAFRSRIRGVYFSIMTQALTFAGMLLFFRNETGFGGNNGFTDFRSILGFPITAPGTRAALFLATVALLAASLLLGWRLARSKFGRVLTALRDAENRLMFCGYDPRGYKLFVWTLSAVLCGLAGALFVPQVGIINPSEMSPTNSIEAAVWVALGGRGTLLGPLLGAGVVNGAKSWFTVAFPEYWLFFLGALFIVVTLYLPRGLLGLLRKEKEQ